MKVLLAVSFLGGDVKMGPFHFVILTVRTGQRRHAFGLGRRLALRARGVIRRILASVAFSKPDLCCSMRVPGLYVSTSKVRRQFCTTLMLTPQ